MRPPIAAALSLVLIANIAGVLAMSVGPAPAAAPTPAAISPAEAGPPAAATSTSLEPSPQRAIASATPEAPDPGAQTPGAQSPLTQTPDPSTTATRAPTPATAGRPSASAAEPSPATACATPSGALVTDTMPSRVLGIGLRVHVFLPPCHDPAATYPALYLIHGTDAVFGGWVSRQRVDRVAGALMRSGELPPFIIVMPASDVNRGGRSVYSWSNNGKGSFEEVLVGELLPFVERKYGAQATRAGRAIGGISRGGYWSIEAGFANPDAFAAVGGHSPSIGTYLIGMPRGFTGMLFYAASIDGVKRQRIWLDAGDRDWARADAAKLSRELTAKGIEHTLDIGSGAHTDTYWTSRVKDYLSFYAADWRSAPRP